MKQKQNIVIVNEFTRKSADGSGSRGKTPSNYVIDYMARDEASEPLGSYSVADSLTRYEARKLALDVSRETLMANYDKDVEKVIRKPDGLGGRAFGSNGISLTDKELRRDAKRTQQAFDEGHTVQKVIVSFAESYLREKDVLADDYVYDGVSPYKGRYDQMKLRLAISSGMDRFLEAGQYQNPLWIAALQSDTTHLHAHMTVVDLAYSPERIHPDGGDRGKILEHEKLQLRHGISLALDKMEGLHFYQHDLSRDRDNVATFVHEVSMRRFELTEQLQDIRLALPDDILWEANSLAPEMESANNKTRAFVKQIYNEYGESSGYNRAVSHIKEVAADTNEEDFMLDALERRGMNAVYKAISNMDEVDADPLLLAKTYDTEVIVDDLSQMLIVSKHHLKQLEKHEKAFKRFRDLRGWYLNQEGASLASEALYYFYDNEVDYHGQLLDDYRSEFSFLRTPTVDLSDTREHLETRQQALKDAVGLAGLMPTQLEKIIDEKLPGHDFRGINYLLKGEPYLYTTVLDDEIVSFRAERDLYLNQAFDDWQMTYADYKIAFSEPDIVGAPLPELKPPVLAYSGEHSCVVNLHERDRELEGLSTAELSDTVKRECIEAYNGRAQTLRDAMLYLEETGQSTASLRPVYDDVLAMGAVADVVSKDTVFERRGDTATGERQSRTVAPSEDVSVIAVIQEELDSFDL